MKKSDLKEQMNKLFDKAKQGPITISDVTFIPPYDPDNPSANGWKSGQLNLFVADTSSKSKSMIPSMMLEGCKTEGDYQQAFDAWYGTGYFATMRATWDFEGPNKPWPFDGDMTLTRGKDASSDN